MSDKNNSVDRFSDRINNYLKYRPFYPKEIIGFLEDQINFMTDDIVADIGSGTGFSAINFLKNGNTVIGIEPNDAMRIAADEYLKDFDNFINKIGKSDKTGLEDNSVDLIIAGQAFHWFNVATTKEEFKRILKPDCYVVLIWNEKDFSKPLMSDYEKILNKYGTDYHTVKQENIDDTVLNSFYKSYSVENFYNNQIFDYEGLEGRLLSSSYIPLDEDIKFKMLSELKACFNNHQIDSKVNFEYITKLYYGKLD